MQLPVDNLFMYFTKKRDTGDFAVVALFWEFCDNSMLEEGGDVS